MVIEHDVRRWYYYPIIMPIDSKGRGPTSIKEAVVITFEVWDQELATHGSFEFLPDAINCAIKLNKEREQNG